MNPLTVNPVIVLLDSNETRSRRGRRGDRDRAVHAGRSARRAWERAAR